MKRISFPLHDPLDQRGFRNAIRQLRAAFKEGWVVETVSEGFSGGLPAGQFIVTAAGESETISFQLGRQSLEGFRLASAKGLEIPAEDRFLVGAEVKGRGKNVEGILVFGSRPLKARSGGRVTGRRGKGAPPSRGFRSMSGSVPSAYDLEEAAALEALRRGQGREAEELRALLGPEYFDLLGDMARRAGGKRGAREGKALVLPGIMGSKLGTEKKLFGLAPYSDVIWLDPVDMRLGRLAELTLTAEGKPRGGTTSVGVLYTFYLRLKLSLDLAGFDADFHDYDWRRPVRDLGAEFAAFLNRQKEPVTIVAHSMGGVVTRAAILAGVKKGKVDRFIMIGTPNHGSFVPAQAMRAAYPFLKTLAHTFDRDLTTVTEEVFSSFAGLYDLLAATKKFSNFALFDAKHWPTSRPKARGDLIAQAASAQALLAPVEQMKDVIGKSSHLICGVNQDTVVDVAVENDEFVFLQNKDGDGTVPRISAELEGVPTFFVEGSHGMLPNYGIVCDLAVDLARDGKTSRETLDWKPPVGPLVRVQEGSLRAVPVAISGLTRGEEPSPAVVRSMLEPILGLPPLEAPVTSVGVTPTPPAGVPPVEPAPPVSVEVAGRVPAGPVPVGPPFLDRLKGVVVGRHRQRQLEVGLFPGSLTSVPSRAYLLGLFQGVAPAGAALAVDQLMGRVISDFVQRRMLSGRLGEVFILPKGRSFILADHIIFVGLGAFDRFSKPAVEDFSAGDLKDGSSFAARLKNPTDPLTTYLRDHLADDTRRELAKWKKPGDLPAKVQEGLIRDFNAMITGPPIWDDSRFAALKIRPETRELVRRNPKGGDLVRLNRLLLEDAYPQELSRSQAADIGSGERDAMRVVCESVVRTCLYANVEEFATVLLGSSAAEETGDAVRVFTRSFLDALKIADPDRRLRKVTICEMDKTRVSEIRTELVRLATTDLFEDVELELRDLPPPDVPPPQAISRGVATRPVVNPVYLLTRMFDPNLPGSEPAVGLKTDPKRSQEIVLETSLLLPRSKAAVLTAVRRLAPSEKDDLIALTRSGGFSQETLDKLGSKLVSFAFDEAMCGALRSLMKEVRGLPLVIVHDPVASQLPWEAFRLDDWRPAIEGGVSRQHLDANLSVAKWLEHRAGDPVLDVLLVTNPTEDLSGAEKEGKRIRELMSTVDNVRLTERRGDQATRERLLADFRTGEFDVVHYAGHAFFAPQNPGRSGLLCAGSEVLTGVDLAGLSNLPSLIFFNACEAGRVRGPALPKAPLENLSVAAALIRGGVANFLGTYWPVGDEAADVFSATFYPLLVSGSSIGEAVLAARSAVEKKKSVDWADYILYGNPEFVLKRGVAN